jgi:ribosome maturation factor RimP
MNLEGGKIPLSFPHFFIEFHPNWPYAEDADEFVRLNCRAHTGWRRDEWAYSPLFICGKFIGVNIPKNGRLLTAKRTMAVKLEAIRTAAQRVAASHGLDVVNLEFIGPAKERVLRVYLEKNAEGRAQLKAAMAAEAEGDAAVALPEQLAEGALRVEQLSGMTHEDCAAFSRDFSVLLDVEDLVPGAEYTLEASSPGLDRKLSRPEDFKRFLGCLVKIQTFEPIRNNRHWQGRMIAGAEAETEKTITLDLAAVKQNSKSRKTGVSTVEIAFDNIEKAQLVPEI